MVNSLARYQFFWISACGAFALDFFTKLYVLTSITPYTYFDPAPISTWLPSIYLVHVYNTGAAWGQFSGYSFLLGVFGIIVLFMVYYLRKQLHLASKKMQLWIGLFCGGLTGNLIDRLYRGYVIDFIDLHLPGYRWPAFNFADIAICLGVFFYCIYSFFPDNRES